MKAELVLITPELASELLSKNTCNRKIAKQRLNLYESELRLGRWRSNGESIKVTRSGTLADGQHRLTAIVNTGISVEMVLVTGLDEDVMSTIDTGRPRSASDVLYINGATCSNQISSTITKVLSHKKNGKIIEGSSKIKSKITNSEILDYYNTNPDYFQTVNKYASSIYAKIYQTITTSDIAAVYIILSQKYNSELIEDFFTSVVEKEVVGGVLLDRLLRDKTSKRRMLQHEKFALVIKSFTIFRKGIVPKVLSIHVDEKFPMV